MQFVQICKKISVFGEQGIRERSKIFMHLTLFSTIFTFVKRESDKRFCRENKKGKWGKWHTKVLDLDFD